MPRRHDTQEYQKAIVKALTLLGIYCVGGFPMAAICGGCLFDDDHVDPDI